MALAIEWTDDAIIQLKQLYNYLEKEWTEKEIKSFTKKLDDQINLISKQPTIYKRSERLFGTRECIITKHNTLFYMFDKNKLYVLMLWSNSMGDNRLKP